MMNTNYGNGMPEITDMHSFLAAVDKVKQDLQTFKENVSHISTLQDRVLNNIGDRRPQTQLDDLKSRTSQLSQSLRDDIKKLQSTGSNSNEGLVRTKQVRVDSRYDCKSDSRYVGGSLEGSIRPGSGKIHESGTKFQRRATRTS